MPYSRDGFQPIGGQSKGAATVALYAYRTTDTYGVVRASGYFNSLATVLRAGDIIVLTNAEGNALIEVAAVSSGVVTTRGARMGAGGARPMMVGVIPLVPVAQANTDFTLTVPTGITVVRATTITSTAFTGNTVTVQLGSTAGGTELVAAVSCKAQGLVAHTLVAPLVNFGTGTVFARLVQTAAFTAVGAGFTIIEYLDP